MSQVIAREIYRALAELARRYQFRNKDEVCCYGLTVSQCYALELLADSDPVSMSRLSEALGLDLSSTTRLIDQLVRKKLVTRQRSPEDARIREIQATDNGKRLVRRIQGDLISLLGNALADLPKSVLQEFPRALKSITFALNQCCETPALIPAGTIRKVGT